VVAATTGPTAAVVVDYIGIALQSSAFVIVLAVLALVMLDSPPPSPPVRAGVFVVLSPALMPQPSATDLTAWIYSAIAIGVSFFVLCGRRISFFVRGIDCVAFFVVYTREPSDPRRQRRPPGYSLAGRKMCPTRLLPRDSIVRVFPSDEIDALPPPPTAPLPRVRVPRGLQTHVKLYALLGCIAPAPASSIALPAPLLALSCKYPALIISLLVILLLMIANNIVRSLLGVPTAPPRPALSL
jgi:hypothetical protein